MDDAKLIYRSEGNKKSLTTGKPIPWDSSLIVDSISVDEEGEWVMVDVYEKSSREDGALMIPKERVIRIDEGEAV